MEIDLRDESRLASLRPYRFLTEEQDLAIKALAGLSERRPDLFRDLETLAQTGGMFVCDLDLAASQRAGQNVLRYRPSKHLAAIVVAYQATGRD